MKEEKIKMYSDEYQKTLQGKTTKNFSKRRVKLVRTYVCHSYMYEKYKKSYEELVKVTKIFNEFPASEAWNRYAVQKNLLGSESLKYVTNKNWNQLRNVVKKQVRNENKIERILKEQIPRKFKDYYLG